MIFSSILLFSCFLYQCYIPFFCFYTNNNNLLTILHSIFKTSLPIFWCLKFLPMIPFYFGVLISWLVCIESLCASFLLSCTKSWLYGTTSVSWNCWMKINLLLKELVFICAINFLSSYSIIVHFDNVKLWLTPGTVHGKK